LEKQITAACKSQGGPPPITHANASYLQKKFCKPFHQRKIILNILLIVANSVPFWFQKRVAIAWINRLSVKRRLAPFFYNILFYSACRLASGNTIVYRFIFKVVEFDPFKLRII